MRIDPTSISVEKYRSSQSAMAYPSARRGCAVL
nr:MAG TPA: hypothetical protein [Caudoviricetes sp.]